MFSPDFIHLFYPHNSFCRKWTRIQISTEYLSSLCLFHSSNQNTGSKWRLCNHRHFSKWHHSTTPAPPAPKKYIINKIIICQYFRRLQNVPQCLQSLDLNVKSWFIASWSLPKPLQNWFVFRTDWLLTVSSPTVSFAISQIRPSTCLFRRSTQLK